MKIYNKTAPSAYKIIEKIEAGIVLLGSEVKAIREKHADLSGSHVKIMGEEAYLVNASIFPYKFARIENYDEKRTRKLLMHRNEITALKGRLSQGNMSMVPLSIYLKDGLIKIELGLVKGKKQFEKKQELKEKELKRQAEQELKNMGKI